MNPTSLTTVSLPGSKRSQVSSSVPISSRRSIFSFPNSSIHSSSIPEKEDNSSSNPHTNTDVSSRAPRTLTNMSSSLRSRLTDARNSSNPRTNTDSSSRTLTHPDVNSGAPTPTEQESIHGVYKVCVQNSDEGGKSERLSLHSSRGSTSQSDTPTLFRSPGSPASSDVIIPRSILTKARAGSYDERNLQLETRRISWSSDAESFRIRGGEKSSSFRWNYDPQEPRAQEKSFASFQHICRITFCMLTGLVVALLIWGFRLFTEWIHTMLFDLIEGEERQIYTPMIFALCILIANVFAFTMRLYFPECTGDGITSMKISMALSTYPRLHSFFIRFVVSAACVASGNPLGILAPALHLGSMAAAHLYFICLKVHYKFRSLGRVYQRRASLLLSGFIKKKAVYLQEKIGMSSKGREDTPGTGSVSSTLGSVSATSVLADIENYKQELENSMPTVQLLGCVAAWTAILYSPLSAALCAVEQYVNVHDISNTFGFCCISSLTAAYVVYVTKTPSYFLSMDASKSTMSRNPMDDSTLGNIERSGLSPPSVDNLTVIERFQDGALYILFGLFVGLTFGALGFAFSSFVLWLREKTLVWNYWHEWFTPILSALSTGVVLSLTWRLTNFDRNVWGLGMDALSKAVENKEGTPIEFYFIYSLGKLFTLAVAIACDTPGGFILPSLLIGGMSGYGLGKLGEEYIVPYIIPRKLADLYELCGCLGASSLMASLTRTPLSAVAVTISLAAHNNCFSIPLILASVLASFTASYLQLERLSDLILQQDGIDPFNISKTIESGVNTKPVLISNLGFNKLAGVNDGYGIHSRDHSVISRLRQQRSQDDGIESQPTNSITTTNRSEAGNNWFRPKSVCLQKSEHDDISPLSSVSTFFPMRGSGRSKSCASPGFRQDVSPTLQAKIPPEISFSAVDVDVNVARVMAIRSNRRCLTEQPGRISLRASRIQKLLSADCERRLQNDNAHRHQRLRQHSASDPNSRDDSPSPKSNPENRDIRDTASQSYCFDANTHPFGSEVRTPDPLSEIPDGSVHREARVRSPNPCRLGSPILSRCGSSRTCSNRGFPSMETFRTGLGLKNSSTEDAISSFVLHSKADDME